MLTKFWVSGARAAAAGAAAAALALLTGCGTQPAAQPVLSTAGLVATWTSHSGGSVTFAGDHRFAASDLRPGKFWGGCAGSGKFSVSGTWQFLNADGQSSPSLTGYQKGSLIYLAFDPGSGGPSAQCAAGGLTLTSWNVGSAHGLCMRVDPDTPCDGYIFDRQ